jgi:hypothetical protein
MNLARILAASGLAVGALAWPGHASAQNQPPRPIIPGLPVPVFVPANWPPPTAVPAGPGAATAPPTASPPAAPGTYDAQGQLSVPFMQAEAAQILRELVAALPNDNRAKVEGIPLMFDTQTAEVNAFAGCENGGAFMAITVPLLRAMGHISEAKAADELFGSQRVNRYTRLAADSLGANGPVPDPPAGFYAPAEALDPRKLARQRDVFDEMTGFVLGHELAHHYLGHTGCANGTPSRGLDPAKLGRIVTTIVTPLNQFNETGADTSGVENLLDMGARRTGRAPMTEMGGVLTLEFFGAMEQFSPATVALGILRTHPHPRLRIPLLQSTAQRWRNGHGRSGGGGTTQGGWPFPLPIPFPVPGR